MLLTTAYHPLCFSVEALRDRSYAAWMSSHILHLAHSHIVVVRDGTEFKRGLDVVMRELLGEDIREVVRVRLEKEFNRGRLYVLPNAETATHWPEVDVVVIPFDDLRNEARECYRVDDARVCSWQNYAQMILSGHDTASISLQYVEFSSMGSLSIKGWRFEDIRKRIFQPVLRWAPYVRVVDRFVGKSFKEQDEDDKRRTWESFRRTICMLFREWIRCQTHSPNQTVGDFEVMTVFHGRTCDQDSAAMRQALLARLQGPDIDPWLPRLSVRQMSHDHMRARDAEHDRYLDVGVITLLFSRGFDLVSRVDPSRCAQCSVSIYHEANG